MTVEYKLYEVTKDMGELQILKCRFQDQKTRLLKPLQSTMYFICTNIFLNVAIKVLYII